MALARTRPGRFSADCLVTDLVGHFVYVTGPEVGGFAQVSKVDIKTFGQYPAVGMIIEKATTTRCLVVYAGEATISPATLTPGKTIWVGTDSKVTDTVPSPGAGERLALQGVGYALGAGRVLIQPDRQLIIRVP